MSTPNRFLAEEAIKEKTPNFSSNRIIKLQCKSIKMELTKGINSTHDMPSSIINLSAIDRFEQERDATHACKMLRVLSCVTKSMSATMESRTVEALVNINGKTYL